MDKEVIWFYQINGFYKPSVYKKVLLIKTDGDKSIVIDSGVELIVNTNELYDVESFDIDAILEENRLKAELELSKSKSTYEKVSKLDPNIFPENF